MRYTRKIDNLTLIVNCDESLCGCAQQLLKDLYDMHLKGPPLKSDSTIHYGWVTLKIKQKDDELEICEPDFLKRDLQSYVPNLDLTLKVLAEQSILCKQLDISPQAISYLDSILVAKDCLKESDIYLERQQSAGVGDSGWYLGPVNNDLSKRKEFYSIKVYELLQLQPEIMPALILPVGYMAIFSRGKMQEILDKDDRQIWPIN